MPWRISSSLRTISSGRTTLFPRRSRRGWLLGAVIQACVLLSFDVGSMFRLSPAVGLYINISVDIFPETVYAAYASSAPVQAQVGMSICAASLYPWTLGGADDHVDWKQAYRGTIQYNLKNCTRRVKLAVGSTSNWPNHAPPPQN